MMMTHSVHDRSNTARWKARIMAARRRVTALLGRPIDPYPETASDLFLSPSQSHRTELNSMRPGLSYANSSGADVSEWQHRARAKLAALAGRILSAFNRMMRLALINGAKIALYGSSWTTLKPIRSLWASLDSKKHDAERMSRTSLEYEPPRIMKISQSPASIAPPSVGTSS